MDSTDREMAESKETGGSQDNSGKKPARTDPCWCGSGQSYEDCHYATDMLLRELRMIKPS